jgi:hypothetical protein
MLDLMVAIAVLCGVLGAGAWVEQVTRPPHRHLPVELGWLIVHRIAAWWKCLTPLFSGGAVRFRSIRHH